MVIKLYKSNKTIAVMTIIVIMFLAGIIDNNHLEFIALSLGMIAVIVIAKISYFSIFSFLMWFCFLQEYFASINRSLSSGRLLWDRSIPVYYHELYICMAFFLIAELLIFLTTNVLNNEEKIYKTKTIISERMANIYSIIALIIIFLAYPTIPKVNMLLERDQGIVSSTLFVPIAMLLFSISIENFKKSNIIKTTIILGIIWVILHGDRVIVMGFLIYAFLKYINGENKSIKNHKSEIFNKKLFISLLVFSVVAIVCIKVQFTRMGITYNAEITELLMEILKQGTAADVVHCFNCATHMWKTGEGLYGYTYLYYFSNILPSADQNLSPAMILMNKYNTLGGGLFFAEPMMNGGIGLCIIHSIVFILILTWLFRKNTSYRAFLVMPFVILMFRFAWYASLAGLVKMVLYYMPILYLVAKKFK